MSGLSGRIFTMVAIAALWAASAHAQPVKLPTRGGEVILPTAEDAAWHERFAFAAARRAGDTLYVSGVVVSRGAGEGNDVAAFKDQVRRGFRRIEATLAASGVTFADVAMINTFHVFDGPDFAGDRAAQFTAFVEVKNEFMKPPHAAWTAVGTTGLLPPRGIVEIQVIAHVPPQARR